MNHLGRLLIPLIHFANNSNAKADQVYLAALYRFHMAGAERENETPLDYATSKVDTSFNAGFEEFMRMYLRLKYSNGSIQPGDSEIIDRLAKAVGPSIRRRNGFFRSMVNYFNIFLALRYFQQPEKTDYETSSI